MANTPITSKTVRRTPTPQVTLPHEWKVSAPAAVADPFVATSVEPSLEERLCKVEAEQDRYTTYAVLSGLSVGAVLVQLVILWFR